MAIVIGLALLPWSARAADNSKAAAMPRFEAGTRFYEVHDYAQTLEEYKAAYLTNPDPAFLFNMGQRYKKLGKPAEALSFYRDYLKKAAPDDPNRASIEARVRELESAGASVSPPSPAAEPAGQRSLRQPPPRVQAMRRHRYRHGPRRPRRWI